MDELSDIQEVIMFYNQAEAHRKTTPIWKTPGLHNKRSLAQEVNLPQCYSLPKFLSLPEAPIMLLLRNLTCNFGHNRIENIG